MFKLVWPLGIISHILQFSALSRGNVDLSSVILEESLPGEVAPTAYTLELHPIPDDSYFKGRVTIDLSWQEDSNKIVLHADPDLVIYQTELVVIENDSPSRTVRLLRSERDPEHSWYIIHLRKGLNAGTQAQLSMTFTGKLSTVAGEGLFLTTYEEMDETKYFIGMFLKPNLARKVFPCYDEPGYKTPFKISIVRKNSMSALSNMPLEQTELISLDPTWSRDYFQESFPMTTYNLGMFISEFTSFSLEDDSDSEKNYDVPIQIWGTTDILEAVRNSTDSISKAITNVGEYLGLPYPLPKLDFVIGAELDSSNWGLIFQKNVVESEILYNVVYQWIGNLVTPGLWSDEIINDGLRTFITAFILLQDDDNEELVLEHTLPILHSMSFEHSDGTPLPPQSADALKIAMVFRMLNYTLGESILKQGLQHFISETKYKTHLGSDVWNAITEQAHSDGTLKEDLSVSTIAESWIASSQVPVLNVKRNYRDNSATFTQNIPQSLNNGDSHSDHKWIIPIVVVKEDNLDFSNTVPITWLKEESTRLTKMSKRDRFIIVNPEVITPVPVNYDERNWKLLAEFLQKEESKDRIPPITRSKLLEDALSLAYIGELSFKTALDMVLFLDIEHKPVVWRRFFVASDYIGKYLGESTTISEKFLHFLRQWILGLHELLNFGESDDAEDIVFKMVTREVLCGLGYKPCIEEAKNSFDTWIESEDSSCSDIISIIPNVCYIFHWGSDEEFELGLHHFLYYVISNNNLTIDGHFLFNHVVSCIDQPWKVERILNVTIFEHVEDFSESDVENILQKLSLNAVGYKTLFDYLVQNWDALKERFEDKEDLWKHFVDSATSHFKTQEGLDVVRNFYSEKGSELGSAETIVEKNLKIIEAEVEKSSVNYPVVEEWLDNFFKNHEDNTHDNFFLYER